MARLLVSNLFAVVMAGLLSMGTLVQDVEAAEWSINPLLRLRGEFNDNLLLSTLPHDSVYGVWTSPEMAALWTTEDLEIRANAQLDFVEYIDNTDLDITQQFYTGSMNYRTERSVWGLIGNYTRDSVLSSEILETGVIGNLAVEGRRRIRKLASLVPSWLFNMNERLSLLSQYNFTDVTFKVPPNTGLFDYVAHSGSMNLSYRAFEHNQIQLIGQYLNFDSPEAGTRSESYGGQLGIIHNFSETLIGEFTTGVSFVSSKLSAPGFFQQTDDLIWVFTGNLQKRFERFNVRIQGSRGVNPTGIGTLFRTDRAAVSISGELSEKISMTFTADLFFTTPLTEARNANDVERRFINLTPTLSWRIWKDELFLNATYRRRDIERGIVSSDEVATASSNSVFLTLTYVLSPWTTSE